MVVGFMINKRSNNDDAEQESCELRSNFYFAEQGGGGGWK